VALPPVRFFPADAANVPRICVTAPAQEGETIDLGEGSGVCHARGDDPMSAFFIPGVDGDAGATERAYTDMRKQVELEFGNPPNVRRIEKVWARRGSTDCITEVGTPDPLRGGTVMAIFDMGNHRPFVVWWRPDGGSPTAVREGIGPTAYSVVEFDS
jgi:hypothetical protein